MRKSVIGRSVGYASIAKHMRTAKRASNEQVRDNARHHLAERMGKLRGLPQKIGQILSMSDDDEVADAFSDLRDNVEPLPFSNIEPVLEKTWGGPTSSVLSNIEPEAHAASLGQVYRAKLHDGTDVAVKVAYPGIRDAVMTDLKMLGWLSAPVGDLRRGFSLADYRSEIVRDLEEELDYQAELRHQGQFARLAGSLDGLIVPEPIERFCGEEVLVSNWEIGEPVEDVANWSQADRGELSKRMLRNFLALLFDHGIVHGDPHPGNYRFRKEQVTGPSYVLFDFGSVLHVSEKDRLLLLKLIRDSVNQDGDALSLLSALDFNESLLEPIQAKLPALCKILFDPFSSPMKYDLARWKRKERLDDVLGDDRWNFRMASPAKFILLMRAFRGILYYLERFGEPVSWERALDPIVQRYSHDLAQLELPKPTTDRASFSRMAKHLKVEVYRDGSKKVSLTLQVDAIEDLESIMDEELIERIKADGTDLDSVVRQARATGYAPAELFRLKDPEQDRQVRVWIE